MNPPTTTPQGTMRGYLAQLAERLTRGGLLAELVGDIRRPYLNVALADTPSQSKRVLCQLDGNDWWFWWAWEQPIGAVDDPELVIDRIVILLRSAERES